MITSLSFCGKTTIYRIGVFIFVKPLTHNHPYKKLALGVTLIALVLQIFSMAMVMGDYLLRTESYAALCINKDKPEMHCNGHCQMTKKMQEENNSDKNNPQTNLEISAVYFVSDFVTIELPEPAEAELNKRFPLVQESATFQQPRDIFRPPVAA